MAKPWWAKVSPDYYKKPSNLSAQLAQRSAHYAAVLADTHLRDEPQVAGAFLNANVPYSVAQRAARQYQVIKDQAATNVLGKAGMPNQATAQQKASGPPPVPTPPEQTDSMWGNGASNPWDAFVQFNDMLYNKANNFAAQVPGIPTMDTALQGLKSVPKAVMQGMSAAWAPVQAPVSQTLSNIQPVDSGGADQFGKSVAGDNPFGSLLGGLTKAVLPGALAASSVVNPSAMAPGQQQDMQRSGYDPGSFASRFSWYYDAMDAGQRAVAEDDIRAFKQEYDPEKVDAVREIITSNYLNDQKIDALSPSTQAFVQGLQTDNADPRDKELFTRLNSAAGARPGGVISNALGIERGSEASQVVSALGDLAVYWFGDPYAGVMKGLQSARLERMVPAGSKAAMENKIVAIKDPENLSSEPATALGKTFDEMLDTVDRIHVIMNTVPKLTTNEAKAGALNQAGRLWGQFQVKHPDLVDHYGLIAQMRSGKIEFIKPKSEAEMAKAEAKAMNGEAFEPFWVKVNDKPSTPGFVLDRSSPEALQRSLNETRADITSRMSEWMYLNAWFQGRPIVKGAILMPGEVAVNRQVRAAIAPIRDALVGSNNKILKYLNDNPQAANTVHFDGSIDKQANLFLGKTDGQWIKQNYTTKWSPTLEKIASKIGMTYSNKPVVFAGPESLETFSRMGLGHMPRRLAQVTAIRWAEAGPAERRMMFEQWQEMLAEAANFKNTPLARETYNVLTKGTKTVNGPQAWSINPGEVYTANRADNEIRVGDSKVAAGIWDYQMADRAQAPNYRVISAMQKRTGLLSATTGLFNARILNGPTAVWKVGKVGNPANMGRQAIEAYGLLLGDQGVGAFLGALNTRRAVANATIADRLEKNTLTKAANNMYAATRDKPQVLREIQEAANSGDVVKYRAKLVQVAQDEGFAPDQVGALAALAEGVKLEDLTRLSDSGRLAVAMSGVLSPLRRARLAWQERTGATLDNVMENPEWHAEQDKDFLNGMMSFALGHFGHASDDAISLVGGSVGQEIAGGARLGIGARPVALPNARDWLGTAGDAGAINWFRELDSRQTDKVGNEVLRALAIEARHEKAPHVDAAATEELPVLRHEPATEPIEATPAPVPHELDELDDVDEAGGDLVQVGGTGGPRALPAGVGSPLDEATVVIPTTRRSGGPATIADILNQARQGEQIPAHLDTAEDVARWIATESENGSGIRALADRLAYDEFGQRVRNGTPGLKPWDDAVDRLVQVQLRDAAEHLGAKVDPESGNFRWDTAYNPMLDKLGYNQRLTLNDLSGIPDKIRPTELSASVYVPELGRVTKSNIVDLASKVYSFTVARPLQRLAINPIYLANKNIAYRQLGPAAKEFMDAGFSPRITADLLEHAANKYAVNATFRYTDNTYERSFFSEITENFLMFQRASEDFLRRFAMVARASPGILSKSYLLMEAANHSGMIYAGPPQDDDGDGQDNEHHLMFTFPGSALMAKAIQEVGLGLGWGDSDLVASPVYSSMSSQVRYVNPSLSNPFGFSTTPLIGMPLRIMRTLFPETDSEVTNTLGRLEGGGERMFAEQGIVQSLLPTPLARLVPALTQDETDGQLASAVRNAIVYFGAAGKLPGEDATDEEIEEAHQSIKDMATNQLVWRAVVGTFSPWAPQYDAPKGLGLPEPNVVAMTQGIKDLRGEWFDVIREAADKVGGSAAMGAASAEWLRRHPDGGSILHPTAFATGTTDNPGNAGEAPNVASGPTITDFMVSNKGWLKDNQAVAYYLLPNFMEAQYSAQGMRDQLRNEVRVHRDGLDFYKEMRYQVAMKDYWAHVNARSAAIAGGTPKQQVNAAFKQWEQAWRTAHPATAKEYDLRNNPMYVKGTLAPALGRLVESGNAPAGVDLAGAKKVWDWYSGYQAQYNKTMPGTKGKNDRYKLNEIYREKGNQMFLGTPVHDLWKAMDIYEDGN